MIINNHKDRYKVTTIAGIGKSGHNDGNAVESTFHRPFGICCSNDGTLYVLENPSHTIRIIRNNQVSTIPINTENGFQHENERESMFHTPYGICISNDDVLYLFDNYHNIIIKLYEGKRTRIAGNGKSGFEDGNALEAMFMYLGGICCSNDGKLYVTDSYHQVVRMLYNDKLTTIAGCGRQGFKDGNALEAAFRYPSALCCSGSGQLYVSDRFNYSIRMIYNNQVTTIAGNGTKGYKDGNALEAVFQDPQEICCSKDGILYLSDSHDRIRMIDNNLVTTIAGNGKSGFQDGNALEAMLWNPRGICVSDDGKIYFTDRYNDRIRMIYKEQKPPFGFALLLDMQNTFCDCQISFNNVIYHLHRTLVNVRCPLLMEESYFSLIRQSKISNESFESFVTFLYSDKLTKEHNQVLPATISIQNVVELIFLFDLLMNCKWILQELKTRFSRQLIQNIKHASIRELIVDLLPLIFHLQELIKKRPIKSNLTATNISYTEYCCNLIVHELQKKQSIVQQHLKEMQKNITNTESYTIIVQQLVSETSPINTTIDDESMIVFGYELTELSKLAFDKTNIPKTNNNSERTILEPSISTQHLDVGCLDAWTRPDFVIKLSNTRDDIDPKDIIEYHVHKLILCGRWKYFCQMIESGLKESNDNQMILSDDWSSSRFEIFMKYIYLNVIEFDEYYDIDWLLENRKLYGITVGKSENDDYKNDVAAYGFEDLYEYCIE